MKEERLAIHLMIAQGALFAAETMIIHQIGGRAPVMLLGLIRAGAGLTFSLLLARKLGVRIMRTQQLGLQLLRGSISLLYLWVMIFSFGHLPFADATAISYTQAAYIAIFSVMILRERVSWANWAAVAVGIVGALLIAKPTLTGWDSVYVIALFGTGLNGLAFVLNRSLQRQDTALTTMLYTNLVLFLGNSPALMTIHWPGMSVLWAAGLIVCGPLGVYAGVLAVRKASPAVLGPYTLLRLVMGVVAGVMLFREIPDIAAVCGAALILASCALSTAPLPFGRIVQIVHRFGSFRREYPAGFLRNATRQ